MNFKKANPELQSQLSRVWALSVPAILTQITTIAMQYIDSAMVGNLGANASAAIGLVSTTTWLMSGVGSAVSAGFSVQVAQYMHEENLSLEEFTAEWQAAVTAYDGTVFPEPMKAE